MKVVVGRRSFGINSAVHYCTVFKQNGQSPPHQQPWITSMASRLPQTQGRFLTQLVEMDFFFSLGGREGRPLKHYSA